jgi:two-component system, chemotaxis family, sensor kinase CheA
MSNDFSQFQDAFFEEAAEHLTIVEDGLLQLEQHPEDLDLLNKIFRSAHSIKGTSGMFGFNAVAQFTHKMETLLDLLRNGQKVVTPQIADLLLKSTDCLKTLVEAAKTGSPIDNETVQRLTIELATASASGSQSTAQGASGTKQAPSPLPLASNPLPLHQYTIAWTPPDWLFQRGLDPLQIFKELANLGTLTQVTVNTSKLPELATMDPEKCYLSWTMKLETVKDRKAVDAVFEFVREDSVLDIEERETLGVKDEAQGEEGTAISISSSEFQVSSSDPKREILNGKLETSDGEPKPLGELLIESGVVSRETLDKALSQQKRVGEILIAQHAVTPQQVEQALQKQKQQESAAQSKKTDTTSIRVDTDKIDKLINLVGELVITQSMLTDL